MKIVRVLALTCVTSCALIAGCTSTPSTDTREQSPGNATTAPTTATSTPTQTATPTPTTPATTPPPTPSSTSSPQSQAHRQLAELRVIDRQPAGVPPYVRKEFGSPWTDIDRNGCNQRDDVLLRDAHKGTVKSARQGRCDHDVLAGTWTDPYTGKTLTFDDLKDLSHARAIQIDHIVPLSEAWRSGAYAWNVERRKTFANRLDNLLAVDGSANASKGDLDPAAWRPRKGFQCSYAKRWIRVKHDWDLGADPSEIRALGEMLGYCP